MISFVSRENILSPELVRFLSLRSCSSDEIYFELTVGIGDAVGFQI